MNNNFYSRFGLEVSLDNGKNKFINRVNELILNNIKERPFDYSNSYRYNDIVEYICTELGLKISDYMIKSLGYSEGYKSLDAITGNSFNNTLQILEILIEINNGRVSIEEKLKEILNKSITRDHINLGINIKNGIFYPIGNKILDEKILEKSLSNIKSYKAEKDYHETITKYLTGDLHGTLDMCFTTLEAFSKEILGNNKSLKANKIEILKYIGGSDDFSKQWGGILNLVYDYLNDYGKRHDGDKRDETEKLEVESTLYLTGIIINLLKEKNNELGEQ